jgi:hypothetical protein
MRFLWFNYKKDWLKNKRFVNVLQYRFCFMGTIITLQCICGRSDLTTQNRFYDVNLHARIGMDKLRRCFTWYTVKHNFNDHDFLLLFLSRRIFFFTVQTDLAIRSFSIFGFDSSRTRKQGKPVRGEKYSFSLIFA